MEIFNDELLDLDESELVELAESGDLDDDTALQVNELIENL